jgi:hypothetical protein
LRRQIESTHVASAPTSLQSASLVHCTAQAISFGGFAQDWGGAEQVAPALTLQSSAHVFVQRPHQHVRPLPHSEEELHVANQFVLLPPA